MSSFANFVFFCILGCLPSTVADFWQMVWEENCRVIVMTTKETERGKNKCARYWPEQNSVKDFGKINVKNLNESSTAHYTLREFLVTKDDGTNAEEDRKVYHYHFQVHLRQFGVKLKQPFVQFLCFLGLARSRRPIWSRLCIKFFTRGEQATRIACDRSK